MLRGFLLFGDDFAYVRLVAVAASARHPCPTLAAEPFIPSANRGAFRRPTLCRNKWTVFIHCRKLLMVARRFLIGSFLVQGFLQFSLCLQIELLVPTLWLTGLLPQFISAADNFDSRRPCHSRSFRIEVPRDVLSTGIFCEIFAFPKLPFSLEPKL